MVRSVFSRFTAGLIATALGLTILGGVARAADHLDSPRVTTNNALDILDVYAFVSPSNPRNTVLVMTCSTNAGVLGPTQFQPGARYEFKIDTNGDAVENQTLRFQFSAPNHRGLQNMAVISVAEHRVLGQGVVGHNIPLAGGGTARAGLCDDPFFFDLLAFRRFLATGNPGEFCHPASNFFATFNCLAIIIELPGHRINHTTANPVIGVWARTEINGEQFDRMGRPTINTVLVPTGRKDEYNSGIPSNDRATFGNDAINILINTYGNSLARATAITDLVFPDILTLDRRDPGGFYNGRRLDDDVIDILLSTLTNNALSTDCVDNDSAFSTRFPYLAPPQRR